MRSGGTLPWRSGMPSGSYLQVHIQCPFYRGDDGKRTIKCEGIIPDSDVQLHYRRPSDFRQQMGIFCRNRYICCEIYRMLMENKYEED